MKNPSRPLAAVAVIFVPHSASADIKARSSDSIVTQDGLTPLK